MVTALYVVVGMWLHSFLTPSVETAEGTYFVFGDAVSRADHALAALYGSDPHLASIGFIWLPLPTLLELVPVTVFPVWPDVVSSGFAPTLVSAVASGAAAALIALLGARFGLRQRVVFLLVALFALNPMILLYGSNGMSEGVAAPGLVGATAMLAAYFHTKRRRYVAAAGAALAIAAASVYQAAPFGLALLLALGLFIACEPDDSEECQRGKLSSFTSLGLLLTLPSFMVAAAWSGANWAIMGDPLFFAHDRSSNASHRDSTSGLYEEVERWRDTSGDLLETLAFVAERAWPFMIPIAALLLIRLLDGRLRTPGSIALVVVALSAPVGLSVPLGYLGQSFGWLRFFMYPLFVAAGWGLYEIVESRRPRRALVLIAAGWLLSTPAIWWAMTQPRLGQQEHFAVAAVTGNPGERVSDKERIVSEVERIVDSGGTVLADGLYAWAVRIHLGPETLEQFVLDDDRNFDHALDDPQAAGITHVLAPSPSYARDDKVEADHPGAWEGSAPGFEVAVDFPETDNKWRLLRVLPEAR